MVSTLLFVFLSFNLLTFTTCKENEKTEKENIVNSKEDLFIPTKEWQIVKKGQPIPKGLHVRVNFETGITEAKLLEDSDKNNNALVEIPQPDKNEESVDKNNIDTSAQRLKEALKNIKSDDVQYEVQNEGKIKEQFKSYEQLKQELGILNITIRSDAEVINELFKKYDELNTNIKNSVKDNKIINILENFEYLVHQIDNAREFINLDGFNKILYKNLNNTNTNIKSIALNILGSCIQNNPKVQIHALETGCVDKLIRILALDSEDEIQNRAVFAISSLLRRFPLAQKHFIKNGGLSVFASFFEKPEKEKLQLKIVTLMYDLLVEHEDVLSDRSDPKYKEKLLQYREVDLKSKLKEQGWCELCYNLLTNNLIVAKYDHDAIERFLNLMSSLDDVCFPVYNTDRLKSILIELHRHYKRLSDEEVKENLTESDPSDHSFYFSHLKELTFKILKKFYKSKSEL